MIPSTWLQRLDVALPVGTVVRVSAGVVAPVPVVGRIVAQVGIGYDVRLPELYAPVWLSPEHITPVHPFGG